LLGPLAGRSQATSCTNTALGKNIKLVFTTKSKPSPGQALWELSQLVWYWRKNAMRPSIRTLPVVALALTNLGLSSLASIFSLEVIQLSSNERLVGFLNCTNVAFNPKDPKEVTFNAINLIETLAATTYSRACYDRSKSPL